MIDKYAPLENKTVAAMPLAVWYDNTLKSLKQEIRKAEFKKWRRTDPEDNKEVYKNLKS